MNNSPYKMPVAIVGMACQLPGADDLESYWNLLISGRSAIREIPADRLDQSLYFDERSGIAGKTSSRLGAFVSQKPFGPAISQLPHELRESADPTHLRFCEVVATALNQAGYDPFDLPDKNGAVFVGHDTPSTLTGDLALASYAEEAVQKLHQIAEFNRLTSVDQIGLANELVGTLRENLPQRTLARPEIMTSMVAGIVSRAFGLTGHFQAVDSACASSLQAIHLAVRSIQSGQSKMAIAGGVADWKIDTASEFSKSGAISRTGSRPFDDQADGVICGEGYVALVLKPLAQAVADADQIWGIVSGVGASTDGRGKGVWAPNAQGQMKAIRRAYGSMGEVSQLQYIEAHATSTQVGDATELTALSGVLQEALPEGKKIPITSVKANIGHTLEAAGIAGVIKTLLCMRETAIPGQINFETPNSNIDWNTLPLYVPTQRIAWPSPGNGVPRKAGVDAFGLGGFNVHVALEEYAGSTAASVSVTRTPENEPAKPDAIAVIGRGCLFPNATNLEQLTHLQTQQATGNQPGTLDDFQYDWRRHKIAPRQIMQSNPLQFFLLEAVDQAMAEAGYWKNDFPRSRTATVIGAEYSGDFTDHLQIGLRLPEILHELKLSLQSCQVSAEMTELIMQRYAELCLEQWPQVQDESGSFHFSSLASRIARTWDVNGPASVIDRGEESGEAILQAACQMLQARDCDMVICAAGNRRTGLPRHEIRELNKQARETNCSLPVTAGAAAVVVKRYEDAQRDGDPVQLVLTGTEKTGTIEELLNENRESFSAIGDVAAATGILSMLQYSIEHPIQDRSKF